MSRCFLQIKKFNSYIYILYTSFCRWWLDDMVPVYLLWRQTSIFFPGHVYWNTSSSCFRQCQDGPTGTGPLNMRERDVTKCSRSKQLNALILNEFYPLASIFWSMFNPVFSNGELWEKKHANLNNYLPYKRRFTLNWLPGDSHVQLVYLVDHQLEQHLHHWLPQWECLEPMGVLVVLVLLG